MDGKRVCKYKYGKWIHGKDGPYFRESRTCGQEVGEMKNGQFTPGNKFGSAKNQYRCHKHKETEQQTALNIY